MMRLAKFMPGVLPVILFLSFQSACQSSKVNAHQRELMLGFVESRFDLHPQPGDLLILIPRLHCRGCVEYKLITLSDVMKKQAVSHTWIITGSPEVVPDSISAAIPVLVDEEAWLDRVNLPIANMTMVYFGPDDAMKISAIPTTDEQTIDPWLKSPFR